MSLSWDKMDRKAYLMAEHGGDVWRKADAVGQQSIMLVKECLHAFMPYKTLDRFFSAKM